LPTPDLALATDYAIRAVFLHGGQGCSAGAQLTVEDSLHNDLVELIRLGDGTDALADRATLAASSRRPDDPALAKGFCYLPTVLTDITHDMRVIREETISG
jgi:betaine-aldehyde dehydrogenase